MYRQMSLYADLFGGFAEQWFILIVKALLQAYDKQMDRPTNQDDVK